MYVKSRLIPETGEDTGTIRVGSVMVLVCVGSVPLTVHAVPVAATDPLLSG